MNNQKHIGRIVIIQESKTDELDSICICPHCGKHQLYGHITWYNGQHGCPLCHASLRAEVEHDKNTNYDLYTKKANSHEYEPYKYKE